MALYTKISLDLARELASPFGLDVVGAEGLLAGSVNSNYALRTADGRRYFLRVYEEQALHGARGEALLLRWLAGRGVPTPTPLVTSGGESIVPLGERPVAIFPWIEGDIRCQARVSPRDTHALGQALARVHLAGSPSLRVGRFRVSDLRARCDTIDGAAQDELRAMAPRLRGWLDEVEAQRRPDACRGLCHGDLFRDNVLWQGGELAALLDFEAASDDVLAFDIAVTLLAWCHGDAFSGELARALIEGYQVVRKLPAEDVAALHVEARLAALRFTTTRITDYAMRAHLGANVPRDWRRFLARFEALGAMGEAGWLSMLGLSRS